MAKLFIKFKLLCKHEWSLIKTTLHPDMKQTFVSKCNKCDKTKKQIFK